MKYTEITNTMSRAAKKRWRDAHNWRNAVMASSFPGLGQPANIDPLKEAESRLAHELERRLLWARRNAQWRDGGVSPSQ